MHNDLFEHPDATGGVAPGHVGRRLESEVVNAS